MAAAVQFRKEEGSKSEKKCAFHFVASPRWMTNFMKSHRISNRRVIRYLFKKEIKSPMEVIESAIAFQNLIQSISTDYNSNFIINTDQTGLRISDKCFKHVHTYRRKESRTLYR